MVPKRRPRAVGRFTWTSDNIKRYCSRTVLIALYVNELKRMRKSINTPTLSLVLLILANYAHADKTSSPGTDESEFAVDTQVYVGARKTPIFSTSTVFARSRAFDRLTDGSGRIALFDFDDEVVHLIDSRRLRRATISFETVKRFQAQQSASAKKGNEFLTFLASPKFIREFDASASTLTLSSPWLNYSAVVKQSPDESIGRFIEFADWSVQLMGLLDPRSIPAQARLELNEALRKQHWQVVGVTRSGGPKAPQLGEVRSEHRYRYTLTQEDLDLIDEAEKALKVYSKISLSEFRAGLKSERLAKKSGAD